MKRITDKLRRIVSHAVVKGSAIVMAGSMGSNILAYAYHVVLGRTLGPVAYGELAALLSLFYLLNVPSVVVQTILVKFFSVLHAKKEEGQVRQLFLVSTRWIVTICVVALFVVWVGKEFVGAFLHLRSSHSFVWLYVTFALYILSIVPISTLQAYQRFTAISILLNIGAILRLIFGWASASWGVSAVVASNIASNALSYGLTLIPLRFLRRIRSKNLEISNHTVLRYSVPTLIATIGSTAIYSQDVLLVKHFFPPEDAGIYAALAVIGKVIFYASSSLALVLFPVIAERQEKGRGHRRMVLTALFAVACLSFALTILYYFFPRIVVQLLYGSSFLAAVPYVGTFGLFISLFTLANMLTTVCLAAGKIGVWKVTSTAAIVQFISIWLVHHSLQSVIVINSIISGVFFLALLVYYTYDA